MYEFTCKVMIDGEEDVVKTFAYSVIEAIDNLVQKKSKEKFQIQVLDFYLPCLLELVLNKFLS